MQSEGKTVNLNIRHLILLQNLFCMNRSHWFDQRIHKVLANSIFFATVVILIAINVFFINDVTKVNILPHSSLLFAYSFKYVLVVELMPLAVLAKRDDMHKKLQVLEDKCASEPNFVRKCKVTEDSSEFNSRSIIILSVLSVVVDIIVSHELEYPASVVATLPLAFAAHDTELLLYTLLVKVFNDKLVTLMEVDADVGMKIYRHVLIAAAHFSEDFGFTISLMVFMSLTTTVLYIGAAVVIDGPRTHKVLSYLIYREIRSLFSLWILCSASFQTQIICKSLIKRLTERLVFELDTEDKSPRELTKRWLKCLKSLQVSYLTNSAFSLTPALPLGLLDYTTNYFLIIVQIYPLIMK